MQRRQVRQSTPSTFTGSALMQPFWSDLRDDWQGDHAAHQCIDAPDVPAGSSLAFKHGPTVTLVAPSKILRA